MYKYWFNNCNKCVTLRQGVNNRGNLQVGEGRDDMGTFFLLTID